MFLSNAKKERIIVDAINHLANKPGSFLTPEIPVGDKGISFDGHINVLSDGTERKESYLGKVDVQVKSTEVDEFDKGLITFSFEMDDYRNYLINSGVLLIVGQVKADGSSKLFYKSLHLMELDDLIQGHGTKKSRVIKLQPLNSLYDVCFRFLEEQKLQPYELVINKPFAITEFQEFKITPILRNDNPFDDEFNIYGVKNNAHFPLTLAKVEEIGSEGYIDYRISFKTLHRLYTEITIQKSATILTIENAIQVIVSESKKAITYKYLNFCSLSVQLMLIPFLKSLFLGERIDFLDEQYLMLPQSSETVAELEDYEKIMNELLETFKILNISPEVSIKDDENLLTQIKGLINIVLYKKYEGIKVNLDRGLTVYRIGKQHSVLFLKRKAESNEVTNAFSPDISYISIAIQDDPDIRYKHSPYMLLDEVNLATALNLNVSEIKRSFEFFDPFKDSTTSELTNMFCLRCISAYILSNNNELLELALYIYDKTIGTDMESDDVMLINKYQIKKWKGDKLSDREKETLMKMRLRSIKNDNYPITIGINILLENYFEIQFLFEQLTPEEQSMFKEYPIYKLMEKEKHLHNRNSSQ